MRSLFQSKEDDAMANTIPVSALIELFERMNAEHWKYTEGAATQGNVDCSGAFVWAYQQFGASIYHGSNRMARVEVVTLIPINVANVVPGMAAFKHHKPGDEGYNLPSSYKQGQANYNGDLNDYYHVGLVDTDTSQVLNAQGKATGFVTSPISQNWSHVALLKQVDYGANVPQVSAPTLPATGMATVYAANGQPVRLRKTASTELPYLLEVPVGETVTLRGQEQNGWTPVVYKGLEGYMMSQFLIPDTGEEDDYTVIINHLTAAQAKTLAEQYPDNSPTITKSTS